MPDPEWKKKTFGEPWTIGDTYNMSIGQGYVAATPIQMITVASAVANGGKVLTPHVVKELRDGNGKTVATVPTNVKRDLNIDPRNIAIMREAMRQSVADGAANLAAARNVQIAGKTGTAEFGETIGNNQYLTHGWFTGFAPFDNPQIAITVFLEHGTGGGNAAPIASRIMTTTSAGSSARRPGDVPRRPSLAAPGAHRRGRLRQDAGAHTVATSRRARRAPAPPALEAGLNQEQRLQTRMPARNARRLRHGR